MIISEKNCIYSNGHITDTENQVLSIGKKKPPAERENRDCM